MSLQESIKLIIENLRTGKYPNENAISQGVVLRILSELGWDTYNPEQVWPEYSLGGRRVDFALCFPPKKPAVFVEVKQPRQAEGADRQLFEYAFIEGVPMAILCDGRTWAFYLPAEQGNRDERRVYKLDLFERTPTESAEKLTRYLAYKRTISGEAINDARADYRDRNRRIRAQKAIPEAWQDLIESEEPTLIDRLASEVETKCGERPDVEDLVAFLKTLRPTTTISIHEQSQVPVEKESKPSSQSGGRGFTFNGRHHPCRTGKEVMVGILRDFAGIDPSFPERCYQHPENQGRSRTYIAKKPSEHYPGRPDLEIESVEFTPGWFVATNVSNQLKEKIIRLACEVAGITLNAQLKYTL